MGSAADSVQGELRVGLDPAVVMAQASHMPVPETHRMSSPDVIDRLRARAGTPTDGPVMMLNINRYTSGADFPDGEAYLAYMRDLDLAVGDVGGSVLWRAPVSEQLIGCDHEDYDELLAVWYPSVEAFLKLPKASGAASMFEGRKECVAHATILELPGDQYPMSPTD